jgi:hypothetical protein
LRATLRIDSSITPARLETAVISAAINLNRELAEWREAQQAAGHATLDDVPGDRINDVSVKAHLYLRAIEAGSPSMVGSNNLHSYRGTFTRIQQAKM